RTKHVRRQRILPVLFVGGADVVRTGALDQLLARESRIVDQLDQRRWISQIELPLKNSRERPPQERVGIVSRLDDRDDYAIRQAPIERGVRRLQVKVQAALVAPALQFEHPIALPHRMAFHQRQTSGFGEQIDQHYRLVIYLTIVSTYHLPKQGMPDIGPWRGEGKIVVD